ncbi:MAG: tRNA (adenosine(37)-N6)-dimethylallyltransferase MiaA, partial [Clostridiales bacterium]|nr:tRNA (adenosine(37)-N6)-dimethylallyltransferase MiaA [Clostridiales bacterium]
GKKVHPNDLKRVVRALEIYHITGKPMSEYRQDLQRADIPYNLTIIGLTMDRQKLYERINSRVDSMVDMGLIGEVQSLLDMGYEKDLISMQGLGYKEIVDYLEGNTTLEEALKILKRDTRRFAKRQYTWFRKDKRINWVDKGEFDSNKGLYEYIGNIIPYQV